MAYEKNSFNGNRNGGGYGGGQRNNYNQPQVIDLPEKIQDYKLLQEDGTITDHLFDTLAENISNTFVLQNSDREKNKGISERQLRKNFDEIKRFDSVLQNKLNNWEEIKPFIQMINSKIAYSVARAKDKAKRDKVIERTYNNLQSFINCGLKQVHSAREYHIFVCLFEAVYGFYYQKKPKDTNN